MAETLKRTLPEILRSAFVTPAPDSVTHHATHGEPTQKQGKSDNDTPVAVTNNRIDKYHAPIPETTLPDELVVFLQSAFTKHVYSYIFCSVRLISTSYPGSLLWHPKERGDPGWGWSRDTMASGGEGKVSNYTFPLENVTFQLRGVSILIIYVYNNFSDTNTCNNNNLFSPFQSTKSCKKLWLFMIVLHNFEISDDHPYTHNPKWRRTDFQLC